MTRPPSTNNSTNRAIAILALAALLALHLDFWRDRATFPALLGMPPELAYRVVWMALAALYLTWFTKNFWRDREHAP